MLIVLQQKKVGHLSKFYHATKLYLFTRPTSNSTQPSPNRPDVLCFSLMNLAKLSWPERDDTGEANVVGVEVLKWVIRILTLYKTSEAVGYLILTLIQPVVRAL